MGMSGAVALPGSALRAASMANHDGTGVSRAPTSSPTATPSVEAPFGSGMLRTFFPLAPSPARVPFREEFERVGDRGAALVHHVRHLPLRTVLARTAERVGDDAWPLLTAWREAWTVLVDDVDHYADVVGYDADRFGTGWRRNGDHDLPWLSGTGSAADAVALYDRARRLRSTSRPRPDALHALEDAAILVALMEAGVPFALDVHFALGRCAHVRVPPGAPPRATHRRRDVERRLEAQARDGNAYWLLPAFLSHAGRRMVETTALAHLCATLLDMAHQGERRAFLKRAVHKTGTWIVDLADVSTIQDATAALARATGPDFPDVAATPGPPPMAYNETYDPQRQRGRMLVQSEFPFRVEYRFFVVDGAIVAGTASDRSSSVLDAHRGGRLDPRVAVLRTGPAEAPEGAYDRGETNAVEARDLVARMARAARALVRGLSGDVLGRGFLDRAYVVDMGADGLGPDAVVEPVEVNTFRNAGLYSVDYARVARALRAKRAVPSRRDEMAVGLRRVAVRLRGFAGAAATLGDLDRLP